jgi:hypothetical protein
VGCVCAHDTEHVEGGGGGDDDGDGDDDEHERAEERDVSATERAVVVVR